MSGAGCLSNQMLLCGQQQLTFAHPSLAAGAATATAVAVAVAAALCLHASTGSLQAPGGYSLCVWRVGRPKCIQQHWA